MAGDQAGRRAPTSIVSFFVVFATLIVVAAGVGTYFVWRATQNAALSEATRDAQFAAGGAAGSIDAAVRDAESLVVSTAESPSVVVAIKTPAGCTLSFAGVGPFTSGHLDFIGPNGDVRCTSSPTAGTTYPMTSWFPDLRSGGPAAVALHAEASKRQVLVVVGAVPGGGYVAAFLDVDVLGEGLSALYGGRRDLEFVVATHSDERILTRSVDDAAWRGKLVADTKLAGVGAGGSHPDVASVPRVYSRAGTTEAVDWFVYAGADRTTAISEGTSDFRLLIIVVGAAVLGLLALFAVMYRRIVGPIRALYRGTRAQRSSPLVVPLPVNGPREIGAVARELNAVMSELSESEQTYRVLFDGNPQPMWVWSLRSGCFLAVNQATIDLYGYTREEFLAMRVDQIVPSAYGNSATDGVDSGGVRRVAHSGPLVKSGPWTHVMRSGDTISVEVTSQDFTYLGEPGRFTIVVDISERLEHERQLQHLALHDELTGLANRTLILDRLSSAIGHAQAQSRVAVLFVDLDGFKLINEVHGHDAGDHLLTVVGRRLSEGLRPTDSIGRVGADEFVIVCPHLSGETEAIAMASRVEGLLALPIELEGTKTFVTASVGISMSTDGSAPTHLVRDATLAMNRAKERGGDRFEIFDEGMRERTLVKLATITELRRAVDNDELRLQFQPEIDLSTGVCNGFEALVRWEHPSRGLLAPAHFVELAEETGYIVQLGAWVLDAACRQAATWVRQGLAVGTISVNLSARELAQPSLVGQVSSALDRSGLEPGRLCLEITETSLMDDPDGAVSVLAALRDLGVKLSIDDFG
ncbi:MAG: diguanylate cyclase/phosphodiesterase & domain with sensor(s), partial [Ilumatobacteraceae bacterium]|nr:diguanylate cyclase/phosphodiesterase & domain with sensor(s) [Ilumatobacteraceae bacterium]